MKVDIVVLEELKRRMEHMTTTAPPSMKGNLKAKLHAVQMHAKLRSEGAFGESEDPEMDKKVRKLAKKMRKVL